MAMWSAAKWRPSVCATRSRSAVEGAGEMNGEALEDARSGIVMGSIGCVPCDIRRSRRTVKRKDSEDIRDRLRLSASRRNAPVGLGGALLSLRLDVRVSVNRA